MEKKFGDNNSQSKDFFIQDCKFKEKSSNDIQIKQLISLRKKEIKTFTMEKRKQYTYNNLKTIDNLDDQSKKKIHENLKTLSLVRNKFNWFRWKILTILKSYYLI